jgi:hypothetical protein
MTTCPNSSECENCITAQKLYTSALAILHNQDGVKKTNAVKITANEIESSDIVIKHGGSGGTDGIQNAVPTKTTTTNTETKTTVVSMVVTGVSPSRKAKRLEKKSSRDSNKDDASTSEINKKKRKHTECVKNAKYYCFKQMKDVNKTCCNLAINANKF